jgi:hypothetical protein
MSKPTAVTCDIDLLVATLPEGLRQVLADLAGAPPTVAEVTLSLLRSSQRALLVAIGATQTGSHGCVQLTNWGLQVIDACALYYQ